MYEYHDAVLHSVREGLVVVDRDGRVTLVNDEGRRLLGLAGDAVGQPVAELDLPPAVAELLALAARARRRRAASWPATGCWSSTSGRPASRAQRSAPCSPCATTPSCAR